MGKKEKLIAKLKSNPKDFTFDEMQSLLESLGFVMFNKGKTILKYMQDNCEKYNNIYKAKDIGDGLGVSGRSVSGSIKKLITDGYVEKLGANPVSYGITAAGKEYVLD